MHDAQHDFEAHWQAASLVPLKEHFNHDTARAAKLSHSVGSIRFDFSKTHLTDAVIAAGSRWAKELDVSKDIAALFNGAIVNASETLPALHPAMRSRHQLPEQDGRGLPLAAALMDMDAKLQAFVARILSADHFDAILHIGIGGSILGPQLVTDALRAQNVGKLTLRYLGSIDPSAFDHAIVGLDPATTLVIVTSKSWTTLETQINASRAKAWLEAAGAKDIANHLVAVTCKPDAAAKQGIAAENILPIPDALGGRFSTWSAVGLPIPLTCGWNSFAALRAGAATMDQHFRNTPFDKNVVWLAALAGYGYAELSNVRTRSVFAYDHRLQYLPSYLQQVELESNGKSVTRGGQKAKTKTAPIVWGGLGTDSQHSVFQLLHQGTEWSPIDFIACLDRTTTDEGARVLVGNAIAQAAALMTGTEGTYESEGAAHYPGNRPSIFMMLDALTPEALGALMAFYEHRTYAQSLLWDINAFDQPGVEFGKIMARDLLAGGDEKNVDGSTKDLLARLRG